MGKFNVIALNESRLDLVGKHTCTLCNKEATHYIKVTRSISQILGTAVTDRLCCTNHCKELLQQTKKDYNELLLESKSGNYIDNDSESDWYNCTRNIRGF